MHLAFTFRLLLVPPKICELIYGLSHYLINVAAYFNVD